MVIPAFATLRCLIMSTYNINEAAKYFRILHAYNEAIVNNWCSA